ncbi:hypothetical protein DV096_20320 [Bradymonadaceae bacterium TMQ3]|uniref:Uncharacterized protein n=1 Tax=Lujinxingia sediminis TaxID=2480984 RepID=A0ABY0CP44_9DELT|nr:hypothetical protein [Lujinxingia sediminis]RDV36189.1 hypothetical protein DV096_20320 [Bradymonadaceae bacterium TMQ3]RVU41023.1 hypothetical protein EA187_19170 [Lujinxingia sediminis]TXC67653.1 hypothetical protein FRC91_19990 [Bradymonadales bacterium TMQ1]
MRTLRNLLTFAFAFGLLLSFSVNASAQEKVTVEVRAIAAGSAGEGFDSQLSDLRRRLERGFAGYSSFRQVASSRLALGAGESDDVTLPDGSTLTMTSHGKEENFVKLGLSIGDRLNTTLRATPGSTFFQAGLNYQDGILILAITVR